MSSSDQMSPVNIIHSNNHLSLFRSKSTGTMQHVPRRLSSGSACETCRRRKTKCDGGQPCAFCASNRIECVHRPSRRKRTSPKYSPKPTLDTRYQQRTYLTPPPSSSSSSSSSSASSLPSSPPSPNVLTTTPHLLPSVMNNIKHESPLLLKQSSCPSLFTTSRKKEIPSMMDQLSHRTFSAVTLNGNNKTFPIFHLHSDFDKSPC